MLLEYLELEYLEYQEVLLAGCYCLILPQKIVCKKAIKYPPP